MATVTIIKKIIILTLAGVCLCQMFQSLSYDPLQWQVQKNKGKATAIYTLVTQECKRLQDDKAKQEDIHVRVTIRTNSGESRGGSWGAMEPPFQSKCCVMH